MFSQIYNNNVQEFFSFSEKIQNDSSLKMCLCSKLTLLSRTQQMQVLHLPCVHLHPPYRLLCTSQRQCKFWPFTEFDSLCPDICIWFCGRPRLPLRSVQGCELTHMSRTAWSVIKDLCPAAWSGKTHLDPEFCCQLLSPSPTLPPVHKADIL